MTTSLENFGTLEYVQDKYSKLWCWKITGTLAIDKISSLTSKAWYGESENEVIIEDTTESIKQLKLLMDRYPLEILSKTVWQRKIVKTYAPKPTLPPINHKLKRAKTGEQFRGKLMNFQKEGLDFLLKSSGNALLADEMGLGKTVQTLSYVSTEKQTFPVLIVAPLVTLNNWEREIEKFLKKKSRNGRIIESESPSVTLIRTGKSKELPKTDIYVINYELLLKRSEDIEKLGILRAHDAVLRAQLKPGASISAHRQPVDRSPVAAPKSGRGQRLRSVTSSVISRIRRPPETALSRRTVPSSGKPSKVLPGKPPVGAVDELSARASM